MDLTKIARFVHLWCRGLSAADRIPTHLTADEKEVLYALAKSCKGVAVEVGSYLGASSCYLSAALRRTSGAKLYCVDTWNNDSMSEGKRDTYGQFLANTKSFTSCVVPLRGNSIDIAAGFRHSIDLLFLDADHDYNGVKSDWIAWSPLLKAGAVIVMHDIGWAEGVQRLVEEDIRPCTTNHGSLPNMFWGTYSPAMS